MDLLTDSENTVVEHALSSVNEDAEMSLNILLESDFNMDKLVSYFLSGLDDDTMYDFVEKLQCINSASLKDIVFLLYLKIGRSYFNNLFKNLCISNCIQFFLDGSRSGKRTDTMLMNEILKVQQLSINEVQEFDDAFLNLLLDEIELEREDDDYSYELLKLLLNIQDQFKNKCTSLPNFANKINRLMISRRKSTKTLSENIIFLMNRSLDLNLKRQLVQFTRRVLEDSKEQEFFYSNDVIVLLDVTIREIDSTDLFQEELLQELISLLPLLAKQCVLQSNARKSYKRAEIGRSLRNILSSNCCLQLKKCVTKALQSEFLKD